MKKRGFKALTLALSVLLAIATACSSGGDSAKNSPAPGNEKSNEVKDGPFVKYDPPIEITTTRASGPTTKYLPGETAENNVWTKGYLNELGIKVKYDWIATPGDEYTQKFNVTLASGAIPDFITVNSQQLKQLVDADMLEDLTEVYKKYASDLTKETINGYGPIPLKASTFNGKLMAIPYVNAPIDNAQLLWVRMDWLKKLNLPEPKTMADVLKISEAFTTQDPDGNGKPDTFGLALSKDIYGGGYAGLPGFFSAYHANPRNWIKDASGKLVFGSTLPEYKTALAELQKLFKAGQLDKEFGVKNGAAVVETIVSGKVGLNFGAMWNPLNPFQDLKKKDPNSDWKAFPLPSIDSQPAKPIIGAGVGTFHVVKKGAKHPAAIMKMTNFFIEKGFGKNAQQDIYFKNNGVEVFAHAHFVTWPPKNLQIHLNIKKAIESKDESKLNPEEKTNLEFMKKFDASGDPEGWAYKNVFGPEGSYKAINHYVTNNLAISNQFYGLPTKTMTEKMATLDKMEIEMATKIIMGAPLDEFDKFVADWKRLGGDAITQEVNDWLKTQQ